MIQSGKWMQMVARVWLDLGLAKWIYSKIRTKYQQAVLQSHKGGLPMKAVFFLGSSIFEFEFTVCGSASSWILLFIILQS